MTSDELLDLFRVEVTDTVQPYLWSDEFIYSAIDDAQIQFCRRTDGIADSSTSAVCDIPVVAGTDTYAQHAALKTIRAARRGDTGRSVEVLNYDDLPSRGWFFDGRPGVVRALVLGMDESTLRVWPMPNETVTIKLFVYRLPLTPITDIGGQQFEIHPRHHRHLLAWVKHLAYSVPDVETYDPKKAADFEAVFERYCFQTAREQERLRHKTRTVAYGGL